MPTEWPDGRYESCMVAWRVAAQRAGLTEQQTAILAAQFAGLCIARVPLSDQGHAELAAICSHAMCTAIDGAVAVQTGRAVSKRLLERVATR